MNGNCFTIGILLCLFALSAANCVPPCEEGKGTCIETTGYNETLGQKTSTWTCSCTTLWEGQTCSVPWNLDSRWMKVVLAYQIFTVVGFASITLWCIYECIIHFLLSAGQGWKRWSIVSYSVILTGAGTFVRMIAFAVDPHSIRAILPLAAYQLIYSLPIIAWISAGYGICIFWIELNVSLNRVQFVKTLRPFLFTILIICWVFLIPTSVWLAVKNDFASLIVYNLGIVALLITFLVITAVFGIKLIKQLKKSTFGSSRAFLKRIMIHMVGISGFLIAIAVTQVLFVFFANYAKYPYVIFHWLLRAEEMGAVSMILILFTRRIPKKNNSSSRTSVSQTSFEPTAISKEARSGDSKEHLELKESISGGSNASSVELTTPGDVQINSSES